MTAQVERSKVSILAQACNNLLSVSVRQHVLLTLVGGVIAVSNIDSHPAIAVFFGMLLGTTVSLVMDDDADLDLQGPLDRIDHAALSLTFSAFAYTLIRIESWF